MNAIVSIGASIALVLSIVACSHAEDSSVTAASAATAALTVPAPDETCGHCDGKTAVDEGDTKLQTVALGSSPSRGAVDAPVTIVVFSDFECPFCAKGENTVREVEAAYPGKVRFVFKNSPLPMHQHARLAAKASLAAGEQGKFWEYHDALFGQQDALELSSLEETAMKLGLDMAKFRAALNGPKLDAQLDADLAEAKRLDVKGTPAFFLNGRNIQGAQPLSVFKTKVDQALATR